MLIQFVLNSTFETRLSGIFLNEVASMLSPIQLQLTFAFPKIFERLKVIIWLRLNSGLLSNIFCQGQALLDPSNSVQENADRRRNDCGQSVNSTKSCVVLIGRSQSKDIVVRSRFPILYIFRGAEKKKTIIKLNL